MIKSHQLSESISMRVLHQSDAAELAAAYVRNRAYLSRWEPVRPVEYYTESWQASDIANRLVAHEAGEGHPLGLFDGETLVGRFNLYAAPSRTRGWDTGWTATMQARVWRPLRSRG